MILGGTVGRDITAGLAALEISGPVGGDVSAEIGETTDNSFTPFTFWSPGMPSINVLDPGYTVDEDQIEGEVNLKEVPVDTELETNIRVDPGFFIFQSVRRRVGEFIALLLVGALAIWLARGSLLKAVSEVKNNAGMDTIWGILVYVLYIPVVFLLFFVLLIITILISLVTLGNLAGEMITISSISFFGLLTLFGMLTSLATKVVLGTLAGRWILEKTTKLNFGNFWHYVGALAIGVFIYEVLRAIPFFGWLLMVVVVVIGTGAIFVLIKNSLKKNVSTPSEDIEATPT